MKKAFTLAEVIIVFAMIGLLAIVIVPTIFSQRPNKEKVMFKKAYFLTERIVAELTNDDEFYANIETGNILENLDEIEYNGIKYSGNNKFCNLFATKVNTMDSPSCGSSTLSMTDGTTTNGNFVTTDGIVWIIPISDFSSDSTAYSLYVDVNGDKKPNCISGGTNCPKPDRFTINLYNTGRINVTGAIEKKYIKDDKVN